MNRSNGICILSQEEEETICHMFIDCTSIDYVSESLNVFIRSITAHNFELDTIKIML